MSKKKNILHVDDEAEMQLLVKMILEKHGYYLESAFNGSEALEKLKRFQPDLILLDIAMPVLDGWEFRRRLRDIEGMANVPVVLLTAKYGSGDAMQGLHAMEVDAYLTKPFNPSELINTVRNVLK